VRRWLLARGAALLVPMRVDGQAERDGLDLTSHGERAYEFD
jgi:Amt family ammonium transporter